MDEREKPQRPASRDPENPTRTADAEVTKVEDLEVAPEQAANVSGGRSRTQPPPEPD